VADHTCIDRPYRRCLACERYEDRPDSDGLNAARGFVLMLLIVVPLWIGFLCWLFK
jgi:hypothetical protein